MASLSFILGLREHRGRLAQAQYEERAQEELRKQREREERQQQEQAMFQPCESRESLLRPNTELGLRLWWSEWEKLRREGTE